MTDSSSSFFQSDQVDDQPGRHALLVRLVAYLKPYWLGLAALFILMALGAVLDVMPSEFTLRLIDHHLAKGSMRGEGKEDRCPKCCRRKTDAVSYFHLNEKL